jgi:hypothetical protein
MRKRKKQHPFLHGAAFLLTGGMSAPASAAMMGSKASQNRKADAEVEYLASAMRGEQSAPAPRWSAADHERAQRAGRAAMAKAEADTARSPADRLRELDRLRDEGVITDDEYTAKRAEIIGMI